MGRSSRAALGREGEVKVRDKRVSVAQLKEPKSSNQYKSIYTEWIINSRDDVLGNEREQLQSWRCLIFREEGGAKVLFRELFNFSLIGSAVSSTKSSKEK